MKECESETEEAKMISNMKSSDDDDDGLSFRRVSVVICQGTRDKPIWVKVTEQGRGQKKKTTQHCLRAAAVALNRRGAI